MTIGAIGPSTRPIECGSVIANNNTDKVYYRMVRRKMGFIGNRQRCYVAEIQYRVQNGRGPTISTKAAAWIKLQPWEKNKYHDATFTDEYGGAWGLVPRLKYDIIFRDHFPELRQYRIVHGWVGGLPDDYWDNGIMWWTELRTKPSDEILSQHHLSETGYKREALRNLIKSVAYGLVPSIDIPRRIMASTEDELKEWLDSRIGSLKRLFRIILGDLRIEADTKIFYTE